MAVEIHSLALSQTLPGQTHPETWSLPGGYTSPEDRGTVKATVPTGRVAEVMCSVVFQSQVCGFKVTPEHRPVSTGTQVLLTAAGQQRCSRLAWGLRMGRGPRDIWRVSIYPRMSWAKEGLRRDLASLGFSRGRGRPLRAGERVSCKRSSGLQQP